MNSGQTQGSATRSSLGEPQSASKFYAENFCTFM